MLVSQLPSTKMDEISWPSVLSLTPSLMKSIWMMHIPNLPQLNLTYSYMPRKITRNSLNVTLSLIFAQSLSSWTMLARLHAVTFFLLLIRLPSTPPALNKNMEEQFCTWCDTSKRLATFTWNFAQSQIKALNITVMLTSQKIWAETLHSLTLAQLSLEVDG